MTLRAEALAPPPIAIQSSPQRRARESAEILASRFGAPVEIVAAVDEIDFGDWTGRSFVELSGDPVWQHWNSQRSKGRPPNGESARSVQQRVVCHLERLREVDADGAIAVVSHAEPIRSALLHYSGRPLDAFLSIEVDTASVSTLSADHAGIRVATINQRVPA
jgi:probable phosphoglycerate mutase